MTYIKPLISIAIAASEIATISLFSEPVKAANRIDLSCNLQGSIPTIAITFSKQNSSQTTPILSFLPQYFSSEEVEARCQSTAKKLNDIYNDGKMKYLASDTIGQKSVICAVERRGMRCDNYSSEILLATNKAIDPTELLYNMLGENFKGSHPPASRSVDRIYTDLRPQWWPFSVI